MSEVYPRTKLNKASIASVSQDEAMPGLAAVSTSEGIFSKSRSTSTNRNCAFSQFNLDPDQSSPDHYFVARATKARMIFKSFLMIGLARKMLRADSLPAFSI